MGWLLLLLKQSILVRKAEPTWIDNFLEELELWARSQSKSVKVNLKMSPFAALRVDEMSKLIMFPT